MWFQKVHPSNVRLHMVRSAPYVPCKPPIAKSLWRTADGRCGSLEWPRQWPLVGSTIYRHTTTNAFLTWTTPCHSTANRTRVTRWVNREVMLIGIVSCLLSLSAVVPLPCWPNLVQRLLTYTSSTVSAVDGNGLFHLCEWTRHWWLRLLGLVLLI